MTKEALKETLNQVYTNEISADDAMLLIWGEAFPGYTIYGHRDPRRATNGGGELAH